MSATLDGSRPLRVLWIRVGGIWPLNSGGRVRSFQILDALARRHRVSLLTTHAPDDDPEELRRHLPACEEVVSVPFTPVKNGTHRFTAAFLRSSVSPDPVDLVRLRVPALRAATVARLQAGTVDVCVADFLHSMSNVPSSSRVPIVLFEHNVEYLIWKRLAAVDSRRWRRLLLELEWRKMRAAEARGCRRAKVTVAVSEPDRKILADLVPGARVDSMETGVDTSYFKPNGHPEVASRFVFTGALDWYPNEDAMLHCVDAMLPAIRSAVPEAALHIVGRKPSARLRSAIASVAGVSLSANVPDVRPHMADAGVYVVPLRVGGGTRIKIFEALAMGKAVVSTGVGAEGLPLVPGEHYLRADDPASFAAAVVALIRDPERRRALGRAGRRLVEERYSWAQVAAPFVTRCEEAALHAR
jgi:glycosyltransferase involved in cell wall biosynthesis